MLRFYLPCMLLLAVCASVQAQSGSNAEERGGQRGPEADYTVIERFGSIDKNKDGLINLYELATALGKGSGLLSDSDDKRKPGVELEASKKKESTVAQVFLRADEDGNGSLSQLEYELYMQNQRQGNVDMPAVVPNIFEKRF
jgi:hypothetical protein